MYKNNINHINASVMVCMYVCISKYFNVIFDFELQRFRNYKKKKRI